MINCMRFKTKEGHIYPLLKAYVENISDYSVNDIMHQIIEM